VQKVCAHLALIALSLNVNQPVKNYNGLRDLRSFHKTSTCLYKHLLHMHKNLRGWGTIASLCDACVWYFSKLSLRKSYYVYMYFYIH